MFSTSITQGVNPYYSAQKVTPSHTGKFHSENRATLAEAKDQVTFSARAEELLEASRVKKSVASPATSLPIPPTIQEKVNNDPAFAAEMAETKASQPDSLFMRLNTDVLARYTNQDGSLRPIPDTEPLMEYPDGTPVNFHDNSYQKYREEFERAAAEVRQQRLELYDEAKRNGVSDAEIFYMLHEFDETLPRDYIEKSSLVMYRDYLETSIPR
ncbi:hypothetical protein LGV61_05205 [Desulfurispirillum indicum]|uniref:hypothetical protein n=1 Tax=Desulfurispirillum indicum TaxID=936456 RepID=UPI001CFA4B70|nr:hypothetical protein [Desulfurispirillum indicum]UCZ57673.1 hypothetical protein LGV61_05205 [Desulfurispirillum indicum]